MGIDAEILLRVKGQKPTDEQVARWGDGICRALGADKFFISDGMPPPQQRKAERAWHEAFNKHPLYAEWDAAYKANQWPNTDADADKRRRELHGQILADLGECPRERRRAIELTNYIYPIDEEDESIPVEYREPGRCWTQDGDPIFAKPGEWFLTVSVWSRYYGVGYERGDLIFLCAVAEWCEEMIPNCTVWYGGDSSGVLAKPWPESERRKLRLHLYGKSGRDYYRYEERMGRTHPSPPPCGLCIGQGEFNQYGFGGNYIAVHCASCGKSFESRDHGASWQEKEKEAA